MDWLRTVDVELFRLCNQTVHNGLFDKLMPFASGNAYFDPALVVLGVLLFWKGGARGRLCLLMLIIVVAVGDGLFTNGIKHVFGRQRPFVTLENVRLLVGRAGSFSMPSGHAANWFSATMVALIYYRRSIWFMLPVALVVSFSRIYNGVHYPTDVVAGAILGGGYAVAMLWLLDRAWFVVGRRWFPLWWEQLPSLVILRDRPLSAEGEEPEESETGQFRSPILGSKQSQGTGRTVLLDPPARPVTKGIAPAGFVAPHATIDAHWLRLGYVCIVLLLLVRWWYIRSGTIQLAEDEAYQWLWSKHLALSYFSKPPLIAYAQFLGTSLWGDTAFGVRFLSPLLTAILSFVTLRFFAQQVNARAGFFLLLILSATPIAAVGGVLMTVDPLSVLFWVAAMLAGWRAVQEYGTVKDWLWVGIWMGLGLMSKWAELFQLLCWAVFFLLWPPARRHLRRPGPYVALLINLVFACPMLIWNYQHEWATVGHLADNADARKSFASAFANPVDVARRVGDFIGAEAGLLNPIFFVALIWASISFWKRNRHNPLLIYFFSMGAPVFVIYFLHSFKARILPNWIAPAVLPLFCLMVIYWDSRWRLGVRAVKPWLIVGLGLGAALVVIGHNTNLVGKLCTYDLPPKFDHLHRVREWDTTARIVNQAREQLAGEGKPVFIIADHYGMAGEISFYLPEAKTNVPAHPLVFCRSSDHPENQFYFWPGYEQRKGENAIYVVELNRSDPTPDPASPRLQAEFETVVDLGVTNVMYRGQYLLRPLHLFACRGLR